MAALRTMAERLLIGSNLTPANERPIDFVPPSNSEKWWASIVLGLLFALLSSGFVYNMTNFVCSSPGMALWDGKCGGPTFFGLLFHTLLFILIVRIILG